MWLLPVEESQYRHKRTNVHGLLTAVSHPWLTLTTYPCLEARCRALSAISNPSEDPIDTDCIGRDIEPASAST